MCFSAGSQHVEGGVLRAAAAAMFSAWRCAAFLLLSSPRHSVYSSSLSSPLHLLLTPALFLLHRPPVLPSSSTDGSICMLLGFFFSSISLSLTLDSVSLTLYASRSSQLFSSQSPIISLSLSLFHLLLSAAFPTPAPIAILLFSLHCYTHLSLSPSLSW